MQINDASATVWEHLEDLRKTLIAVLAIVLSATALSFAFYQPILNFLTWPLSVLNEGIENGRLTVTPFQVMRERVINHGDSATSFFLPADASVVAMQGAQAAGDRSYLLVPGGQIDIERLKNPDQLVLLGPVDGFRAALKACFWFGLVASSPLWLLFVFRFIAPALTSPEQGAVLPLLAFCVAALLAGVSFGFFVTIPLANRCLFAFNGLIAQNLWTLSHYLDYTVLLLLANGLAFELAALLLLLVHYGVVSAVWLIHWRRHMYVAMFILAALLTPPDVFTQLLMAIPLCGMYEVIVLYAKARARAI